MSRSWKKYLAAAAALGLVAAAATSHAAAACVAGSWEQPPNFVFDSTNGSFPVRAESAHFVLRWPADKPNLLTTEEAQRALEAMERIYAWFMGPTVRWQEPFCSSSTKYKFSIFTNDGYGLSGAGNGRDGVEAPAMWVGPGALRDAASGRSDRIGGMVHEFTHAMQYASRGMRTTEFGGWFWESHAEFMAHHYPGNSGKVGCTSLSAWHPHLYYGSTRVRYCNWQFWAHIKNKYGFDAVNSIWARTAGIFGQDPLAVLMRNQGWSAARLGDEFGDYAMRNVNWDYTDAETGYDRGRDFRDVYGPNTDPGLFPDWSVSKRLRLAQLAPIDLAKRRFVVPSYFAPQRYGYNHVRLVPDAGARELTVNLRGVVQQRIAPGAEVGGSMAHEPGTQPIWTDFPMPQTPASNWRWGVVVIEGSGNARYSALQRGASGSLRVPLFPTDREVYMVVSATPDDFHGVFWDQKYNTLYRYPYKVELVGAMPDGYQPNFDIRAARGYPPGRPHPNGGGWVADAARVSPSAYVGPNAAVLGGEVLGNARIEDHAIVWNGTVRDNAVVGGLTQLADSMTVADSAVIRSVMAGGQSWSRQAVIGGTAVMFGDLEVHTEGVPVTKGSFSGFGARAMFADPAHGALRTRQPVEVTASVPAGWPDEARPGSFLRDFNGDGKPDVLSQNVSTGERYLWIMNGTTRIGDVNLGNVPVAWQMAGSGDFNGDGKADILWQHTATGDRHIWFMNGSAFSGSAGLGTVPRSWSIAGTGDFNGDGQTDILWQNTSTGDRYVWFMNGATLSGGASLGVVPTAWSIAGTGDFNGDGRSDIVWQNTSTGDRYVWFMNGITLSAAASLGVVSTAWSIAGTGDFNGDGQSDIIWQNTSTGDRYVWFMNGASFSGAAILGRVPTEWRLVP